MGQRRAYISGDKTICLPIEAAINYEVLVHDRKGFRRYLDEMIERYPEIFPAGIEQGYCFHGFMYSSKQEVTMRRIRLVANEEAYQIRPDFVMPGMIGTTEEVEKGLYLRRYGVPYEGIAHVLGHSAMYWYNACQRLGNASIVGTTVKDPESFPPSPGGR
jgi:hypothetical protein